MFQINLDLGKINYKQYHNWVHLFGALFIGDCLKSLQVFDGPLWPMVISYSSWLSWEIWDGFKPWYYDFKYKESQSKITNWLRENLLYSNKFSLQDALVWDLIGTLLILILYL